MQKTDIEKDELISSKELVRFLKNKLTSDIVMSAFGYTKLNRLYNELSDFKGVEFAEQTINHLGISCDIDTADMARIPKKGAFIMVSNHPYGGVEGLILLKEITKVRPDLKIIANFLFHRIEPIKEYIFPVNPFEDLKDKKSSSTGIKQALEHLSEGKPLLIFPAGEVSTYYSNSQGIADRKWMKPAIKFIKKAQVPIVPVYFNGSNSFVFHTLGFIHPILRTAKLPSELLNKKNKTIQVRIGSAIPVKEQDEYADPDRFGRFLRARTYLLGTSFEVKKFFSSQFSIPEKAENIAEPVYIELLKTEVNNLPEECLLFKQMNYRVYCAPAKSIPNVINELGRLREITFRAIGEGTNKHSDIDEYDLYYRHLFIWDEDENRIAGAYRIGMGGEILHNFGLKGFYIRSLFKLSREMKPILNESLELGRSFVVSDYQRTPMPLFLLWKGILQFLILNPDYRYLIGPVSISNNFKNFSKSMIVDFITKNHYDIHIASFIKPRKRFKVELPPIDTEILNENVHTLRDLDTLLRDIEIDNRVPVLLKKYIELNGKIIGFNVDPLFNNALDGLLLLDLLKVPENTIRMLSKEIDAEILAKRFKYMSPESLKYAEHDNVPQL